MRLSTKISNALSDLDALHAMYPFVPASDGVRPSPEEKASKLAKLAELESEWKEFVDFIYHHVFECPFIVMTDGSNRKTVPNRHRALTRRHVFQQQLFPYQVSGQHYVLWYTERDQVKSDEEVTADIKNELVNVVGSEEGFDFGWYVNPKMTVPEFFHVQVFWDYQHNYQHDV